MLPIVFLSVLFLLDITKPFEYYLHAEFLLVGIIACAFVFPFSFTIVASVISGVMFDCVSSGTSLRSVEFPLYVLIIHSVTRSFKSVLIRRMSAFFCIAFHVLFVSLLTQRFFVVYSISFFLQSAILLFVLRYTLKQWTRRISVDSI
ncbi:MAG: hypothetical protein ABH865_04605 [Candidatus Omnitrophota bacterium]